MFLRFFSRALMLLLVMPISRYARARVAYAMGDDTAALQGRMTLNPFAHLDPVGSLLMFLTGFGWGRPMDINPVRFRNYRKGVILVSLAGPAANLIVGFVCALIYNIMLCFDGVMLNLYSGAITPVWCLMYIIYCLFSLNVSIAVFYLLPVPPMDGFTILRFCAGGKFQQWYYQNQYTFNKIATISVLVIILLPPSINPFVYLTSFIQDLVMLTVSWIPKVFH